MSLRGEPRGEEAPGALRSLERSRLSPECRPNARGASLLEFALTLPVLLVLLTAGAWHFRSVEALPRAMTHAAVRVVHLVY